MPSPDDDALPVADPVPPADPIPVADPVPAEEVDLPVATPVAPPPGRPRPTKGEPRREVPPVRPVSREGPRAADTGPPRTRALSACCVIGCLGGAALGAVGFLAFVVV